MEELWVFVLCLVFFFPPKAVLTHYIEILNYLYSVLGLEAQFYNCKPFKNNVVSWNFVNLLFVS